MKRLVKLLLLSAFLFAGCDGKIDISLKDAKLDRDTCSQCKMVISSKNYITQIVNPKDGKHYFFDDIGCALSWLESVEWKDEAIVYATDFETLRWIDAKNAFFESGAKSPMNYGYAAYEKARDGGENLKFSDIQTQIKDGAHEKESMSHHHH